MRIGGFHKNSFVDYPGQISAVVFTQGCNMNCFYCHNKGLCEENDNNSVNREEILKFLKQRSKFIDAVVITGGEPTLQHNLEDFINSTKELGYSIKLDTNGTNPNTLKRLIDNKMIDYVAMDIKAPLEKYDEVCGLKIPKQNIEDSINILMNSNIDYEFRTTFIPQLDEADIHSIANRIKGSKKYVLQQYKPLNKDELLNTGRSILGHNVDKKPHSENYIYKTSNKIKDLISYCEIRGLKGELKVS